MFLELAERKDSNYGHAAINRTGFGRCVAYRWLFTRPLGEAGGSLSHEARPQETSNHVRAMTMIVARLRSDCDMRVLAGV